MANDVDSVSPRTAWRISTIATLLKNISACLSIVQSITSTYTMMQTYTFRQTDKPNSDNAFDLSSGKPSLRLTLPSSFIKWVQLQCLSARHTRHSFSSVFVSYIFYSLIPFASYDSSFFLTAPLVCGMPSVRCFHHSTYNKGCMEHPKGDGTEDQTATESERRARRWAANLDEKAQHVCVER